MFYTELLHCSKVVRAQWGHEATICEGGGFKRKSVALRVAQESLLCSTATVTLQTHFRFTDSKIVYLPINFQQVRCVMNGDHIRVV